MDLSSLHDGLHASIRAIESKLNHRAAIANKRRLIEASLLCISQLDLVDKVINGNDAQEEEEEGEASGGENGQFKANALALNPILRRKKHGGRHRRDLLR